MKRISKPQLADYHTFAIAEQAEQLYLLEQASELKLLQQQLSQQPMVLGAGANLLFVETPVTPLVKFDFSAVTLDEQPESYLCRVEAGKDWPELVAELAQQGIGGLENLALIPGTVGAAPIQNIGAYGVEFCQLCQSVEVFDWQQGEFHTLTAQQCQFDYRHSLFKLAQGQSLMVVAVTLRLPKRWQPAIQYQGLADQLKHVALTPLSVMSAVVKLRQQKLPDPSEFGNAGSFFKNPTLSHSQAATLRAKYSAMPQFEQTDGVKVPAAWLIDQLGWKGRRQGGAQVHAQQALVLINRQQARAADIVRLAHAIQQDVEQHFAVLLQPEVRFIGRNGEITLEQAYASTCVC